MGITIYKGKEWGSPSTEVKDGDHNLYRGFIIYTGVRDGDHIALY